MKLHIELTDSPISSLVPPFFPEDGTCGSCVEFRGIVRADEKGSAIQGLNYEAYRPMAEKELERLLHELAVAHPCLSAEVIHRLGWVPVDEASIYIRIRSTHRREGFQLLAALMGRLKQDVPIWKSAAG